MEMEWVGRYTNSLTLGILSFSTILIDYINIRLYFQSNEKPSQRWLDHELEVMVNVHQVRYEYEKQSQVYAMLNFLFNHLNFRIFLPGSSTPLECPWHPNHVIILLSLARLMSRKAALAEELAVLRQVGEIVSKGVSPSRQKNGASRWDITVFLHYIFNWTERSRK